jgi:hypothetical protein
VSALLQFTDSTVALTELAGTAVAQLLLDGCPGLLRLANHSWLQHSRSKLLLHGYYAVRSCSHAVRYCCVC